ncbi:MAG: calcium/sodium antiporter [Opitutales bacterium]
MSTNVFLSYASMPAWVLIVLMLIGVALLCLGGDKLTGGAAALGLHLKIDPVIIGLTIVAVATSMPELFTTLLAAVMGSPDLAVGNIVGSNIVNIGLILGLAGFFWPFKCHAHLAVQEMPILLVVTIIFCAMGYSGGVIDRKEGFVLLGITVVYIFSIVRRRRSNTSASVEMLEEVPLRLPEMSVGRAVTWVLAGGVLLAAGSDLLVNSAIVEARNLGVGELVIGLTIVALGTSLPELATVIASSIKGQSGMAAGNIVGSNLFNMMLIGGGVSAISPLAFSPRLFNIEIPAMFGLTVLLWLFMRRFDKVGRVEGGALLLAYAVIIWTTVRAAA